MQHYYSILFPTGAYLGQPHCITVQLVRNRKRGGMIYGGTVGVVNTVGAVAGTSCTGAVVVARSAAVAGER